MRATLSILIVLVVQFVLISVVADPGFPSALGNRITKGNGEGGKGEGKAHKPGKGKGKAHKPGKGKGEGSSNLYVLLAGDAVVKAVNSTTLKIESDFWSLAQIAPGSNFIR